MSDAPETFDPAPNREVDRRQFIVRVVSILITVVLLADLIGRVEWDKFDQVLGRVEILSWCAALLAYFALNIFRALRFRILLDKSDSPWRLLIPITLYHNFLVRALPFKLGEVSYIVLLRSRLNYSMEEGVSSLFSARILELLIIIMVFAGSIPASAAQMAPQRDELALAIAVTFVASVAGLYFGGTFIRALLKALQPVFERSDRRHHGFAAAVRSRLLQLAGELDRVRQPRLFFSALFTSCFTYASSFLANFILLRALGVEVELPAMVSIISIGMFASAFPFTVSGFGVVEAAWLVGLTQFAGIPDADATAAGFLLHGFQIFAAAIYGLIGYLLIHISPKIPSASVSDQERVADQGMYK